MKKMLGVLAVLMLCASTSVWAQGAQTLLSKTFTTAVTAQLGPVLELGRLPADGSTYLALQANFFYSAGGTNVTAWVQTSLDGGLTWADIASFQFTTTSVRKLSTVHIWPATPFTANTTATDGTLTANTVLNGLLGDRLRVKYTSTGTYTTDPAVGILTYTDATDATAGKIVTINTTVYKFVAVVAVAGDVKIGANADATQLNFTRCVNKTGGTEGAGQDYMAAGGLAHPQVSAVQTAGSDIVTLTQRVGSTAGNSYPLTTDEVTITPTAFTGGTDDATSLVLTVVAR